MPKGEAMNDLVLETPPPCDPIHAACGLPQCPECGPYTDTDAFDAGRHWPRMVGAEAVEEARYRALSPEQKDEEHLTRLNEIRARQVRG